MTTNTTNRQLTKLRFKELLRHYGVDAEPATGTTIMVSKDDFYKIVRRAFQAGRDCDVMHTALPTNSSKQK